MGSPGSLVGKECLQCRRHRRREFDPWVGKIPWGRKWQPTPVFLPGKTHGQGSLADWAVQRVTEPDTIEWLKKMLVTQSCTTLQSHGLQPTRFPCPSDFLSKSTWTWVWVNSGTQLMTGKPSMVPRWQRVGHDWATEPQQTLLVYPFIFQNLKNVNSVSNLFAVNLFCISCCDIHILANSNLGE